MSIVKRRTIVGRHTVRHRVFEVERIEWKNTDGLSFDVHDVATGALLTQESLDDEPGPVDIEDLLDRLADELDADTLDPMFFEEMQLRTILRPLERRIRALRVLQSAGRTRLPPRRCCAPRREPGRV